MEEDTDTDTVIGLDVRGQVFYCNKSKLLNVNNGSSYFSARFREDSMLDASLDRVDDEGRDIYKLDVDPIIFQYIIEYINTGTKPKGIGVYEKNKKLWSLVREEAIYFGLDSLIGLLRITFSCSPEVDEGLGASGEGIMHWLGTKKGTDDYVNPCIREAVDIYGWHEDKKYDILDEEDKALLVQYRPNPEGKDQPFRGADGELLGCSVCCSDEAGDSIYFHLLDGVSILPSHYSIRNGHCYGMSGDWNLEASTDGKNWDVIHESRGRSLLHNGIRDPERLKICELVKSLKGEERKDAIGDYIEQNHRHTWKVQSTVDKFYTHFRVTSIAVPEAENELGREYCLHGIGFEIYGDVYEEWDVQLEDQNKEVLNENEKLKSQNEALLSENDSLKARIRLLESKRSAAVACLLSEEA